jgi:hypothetical protein
MRLSSVATVCILEFFGFGHFYISTSTMYS